MNINSRRIVSNVGGIITIIDLHRVEVETMQAFTANDSTPSVASGSKFRTANTVATSITTFDNPICEGQEVTVFFNDAFTSVVHGSGINMAGGASASFAVGDVMDFIYYSGTWYGSIRRTT